MSRCTPLYLYSGRVDIRYILAAETIRATIHRPDRPTDRQRLPTEHSLGRIPVQTPSSQRSHHLSRFADFLRRQLYIYIYIYIYVCVCVCVCQLCSVYYSTRCRYCINYCMIMRAHYTSHYFCMVTHNYIGCVLESVSSTN